MADVFWIGAGISAVASVVLAILGFVVYPAQVKRQGKPKGKKVTPAMERQGLARSMFIIAGAATFTCGFFAFLMG
ncbi:MAG: hypothetical protein AAGI46_07785 [Planctomycetota bacterium]